MRMNGYAVGAGLALLLAGAAPAQREGGVPPVSLEGVWAVSVSSISFAPDGTGTRGRARRLVWLTNTLGEGGLPTVDVGGFHTGNGILFPMTDGPRFANSFFARSGDAAISAAVRVDPLTGEGLSFRALSTFHTDLPDAIAGLRLKGKRLTTALPTATTPIFSHNFESGLSPYTETDAAGVPAATLWHAEGFCADATAIPVGMGTMAGAYNLGDALVPVYNFDTGVTNAGALQGPSVMVPADSLGVEMSFDTLREVESGDTFDQSFVEILPAGGASWLHVAQITSPDNVGCGGPPVAVTISPSDGGLNAAIGTTFQHRFRFDSRDNAGNSTLGWYVDNVVIRVYPTP